MSAFPDYPDESFKIFIYEQFSRVGKIFSSPHRLIILNILCHGEHSVESVARHADLTIANVSRHLQMLKSVNLIKSRKEGKYTLYSLADDETCHFFSAYRKFTYSRLPEIALSMNIISDKPTRVSMMHFEDIDVDADNIVILDVRPKEEYISGHIPNAISIPLGELENNLDKIPKGVELITYCRDNYCILADKAMAILFREGFHVRRLDIGFIDWKLAGLPITLD